MTPSSPEKPSTTYADAGVNVKAGKRAVDLIKDKVRATFRPEVVGDLGGFGSLFAFDPSRYRHPILVSATDGVGTKLLVAQKMGLHDTVGIDLVAMCVDDVAAQGAEPLFFLDYIAIGKLNELVVEDLVAGMAKGCQEAGCALVGGEIAEHPGAMEEEAYDLAGFCVGAVDRDDVVTGEKISVGDVIIGVESSGIHSNGFSLARKVLLEDMSLKLDDHPMELSRSLGEELLRPTIIYTPALLALHDEVAVTGFAHITGGGIPENLGRILPEPVQAVVEKQTWEVPPIFRLIEKLGQIETNEMFSTFNMGLGMIAVVEAGAANSALDVIRSKGHRAHEIGVVASRGSRGPQSRAVLIT